MPPSRHSPQNQPRRADAPDRTVAMWVHALRSKADAVTLKTLPTLADADASRVMAILRMDPPAAAEPSPVMASDGNSVIGHFRPRISLQTLDRGHGLLGLKPQGKLGPRGDSVTLAQFDWTYQTQAGDRWQTPAPTSILNNRAPAIVELFDTGGPVVHMQRDLAAEADAMDLVWEMGFVPLAENTFQWRSRAHSPVLGAVWTLPQEEFFGDFWADQIPQLQAKGWSVVVQPGFAHESVPVQRWKLLVSPETGDIRGRELDSRLIKPARGVDKLQLPEREGAWLLSLGIEIDGQTLDLVPMLADLLRRDARWLNATQFAAIDDLAIVSLRAPGGKRIDAPAAPLKAIIGAMVDLLTDPTRNQHQSSLHLGAWEARRLDALRASLLDTHRVGPHNTWQLEGEAGLTSLAKRLKAIGTPQSVTAPQGLQVQLRPYQLEGLAWLQYLRANNLGGILADDMGLGKTAQALAHVLTEKHAGRLDLPVLVVLPTSLIFNWQAECRRMAPDLRLLTLQGPQREALFAHMSDHDLVLTTYALLWRDVDALAAQCFHLVILDEAQMVKNAGSRSARALRRLQTRHSLCLTGTPMENHLSELWAQFDWLMPGFLGDSRQFAANWRKPIEENGETVRAALLAQRVRPFILRRRKQDVASELPPRTDIIKWVQLQGQQRELYESVRVAADKHVRRVLQRQDFNAAQISILDALLKLRQVCCDPHLVKGNKACPTMERAKLELLADMLPALVEEGRRVLVFSQFTELLDLVAEQLQMLSLPFLRLTGKTPAKERGSVVQRFQAQEAPVLLLSLKAGGIGLNLTAADTVIHLDPWWNPAVEEQATARAHRIGQDQPVFVYKLVVQGSIEERMLELQARKQALANSVLGHDAAGALKFDEADLQALLSPLGFLVATSQTPEEAARRWGQSGRRA
ncbi:ATP-dependent helicase [Rhodoferax fermentans]|nr:ATP-dependent helicase [Rhodoferax fermentans]